jgi:hypothetical protein
MRTSLLLGLLLALSVSVRAAPFLVCDPYAVQTDTNLIPVSFNLTGIAAQPISVPVTTNADGTKALHYDLANLGNGTYTVTAAAVNVFGGTSPAGTPFTFTKGVPATPTNLRISPQ